MPRFTFTRNYKLFVLSNIFSFILGSMLTVSLLNLDSCSKCNNWHNLNKSDSVLTRVNQNSYAHSLLIIIIISEPSNFKRRQVIRETWLELSNKKFEYKHFFVVGVLGVNKEIKNLVLHEQSTYGDMLVLSSLVDVYSMLTRKVLETFLWLHQNVSFRYVLKCDDDSFVRVDDIIVDLKKNSNDRLYWGFFNGRARVQRSGKWKETNWILCDYYLPYALGGGYVLSSSLVQYVAENAKNLSLYISEDVSMGAWLGSVEGVQRVHDPRFDTEATSRGCSNSYLVTHKHSSADMQQMAATLQSTGRLCTVEYRTRNSYIYNWSLPPSRCCSRTGTSVP
ncbi:beta-1,3-galactosyltransferase 6-like [Bacillus rossius redtenbacheri]|uniref:beta-1,3-galactosyltransferase 6-like n=1 Tax=Bacillus rossius redtenbacheri TaxID=93214 RepID=UPI002FDE3C84